MEEDTLNIENRSLVLDLVEWVAKRPRPYTEVMEAWRTSCPRLTVWEDAVDHDLVIRSRNDRGETMVAATERGRKLLETERRRQGI